MDVSSESGRDPVHDFEIICQELELFVPPTTEKNDNRLSARPKLVVANKIDVLDEPDRLARLSKNMAERGILLFPVSAITGEGLPALVEALWQMVKQ